MKKHFTIFSFVIGSIFCFQGLTQDQQNECMKVLEEAGELYNRGEIDKIPIILQPCMESGFTRNQRIAAYKLIILTYLFDDNQYEAEKTMLEFLRKYPEYEIMHNDPVEFVYLFQSFRTTSIFTLNFSFGPNFANPRIIEPYSSGDIHATTSEDKTGVGFQYGLGISKHVAKNVVLHANLIFTTNNYSFTDKITYTYNDETIQLANISLKETQKRLDIPITISYEISTPKLDYYIKSGICFSKLNSSVGVPERQISEDLKPISGAEIKLIPYRSSLNYFGVIGFGTKMNVPRGNLFLEFTSYLGLNNIVRTEDRFSNSELWSRYYYIDDDFALNSFALTLGYNFSFYKPKKLN